MKHNSEYGNPLWNIINKLSDLLLISVCWLLCCIPVVTIGTSCIALYDAVSRCIRGGEDGMCRRFFRTFKNELGRGILITLLWAVLAAVLYLSYLILCQSGYAMLSMLYFCSMLLPLAVLCWVISVESRFVYSFGQLHKVAFIFAFGHLPKTLAIVAMLVVAVILVLCVPGLIFLVPGLLTYLQSYFFEKVFIEYMDNEPEA